MHYFEPMLLLIFADVDWIRTKQEVKNIAIRLEECFNEEPQESCIHLLQKEILSKKIRFPLLEELSVHLVDVLPKEKQISFCDAVMALNEMGSSVIAGKLLQLRLAEDYLNSLNKAVNYISESDEWYVCDHIAERVQGVALLTQPDKTIPYLKKLLAHENPMAVRSVGVATHYAVKKGLSRDHAEQMLQLLLQMAEAKHYHIKTGVGWGAKTIVKFYPELAGKYKSQLEADRVGQWFKTKIKIGLGRSGKYARRD